MLCFCCPISFNLFQVTNNFATVIVAGFRDSCPFCQFITLVNFLPLTALIACRVVSRDDRLGGVVTPQCRWPCPMTTTVISRPRRVLVIGPYVPQPCVHPLTAVDSVSLHPRVVLCCPPVCGFVSRRSRFFCGGAAFVLWWRPLVRTWIVIRLCGTLLCGVSRWGLNHGSYGHNWAWWGSRRAWGWFCGCFRPPWWRCAAFFP